MASRRGEQLRRIVGRSDSREQHDIVAGLFSSQLGLPSDQPTQRVEPMDRAGESSEEMAGDIVAVHMRQLMKNPTAPSILRPTRPGPRKQHRRITSTPGTGPLDRLRLEKPNRSAGSPRPYQIFDR